MSAAGSTRLQGKVAVVTGAGRGIGRAIALRLAADGAAIVVNDLKTEPAAGVASEITAAGGTALAFAADVTKSAEIRSMVDSALARFGQIDILVNNAGGSARLRNNISKFEDADEEVWKWVIDLNLHGTMICIQSVLNHMIGRRYGKIINFGSIAGVAGLATRVDYSAAKGGIIALTKSLAMEVGEYNINVNCISPGAINARPGTDGYEGTWLGRQGAPSEVAALASFLASDEAGYITGANYLIDGGRVLGPRDRRTTQ